VTRCAQSTPRRAKKNGVFFRSVVWNKEEGIKTADPFGFQRRALCSGLWSVTSPGTSTHPREPCFPTAQRRMGPKSIDRVFNGPYTDCGSQMCFVSSWATSYNGVPSR
jgi:hypothetical protein